MFSLFSLMSLLWQVDGHDDTSFIQMNQNSTIGLGSTNKEQATDASPSWLPLPYADFSVEAVSSCGCGNGPVGNLLTDVGNCLVPYSWPAAPGGIDCFWNTDPNCNCPGQFAEAIYDLGAVFTFSGIRIKCPDRSGSSQCTDTYKVYVADATTGPWTEVYENTAVGVDPGSTFDYFFAGQSSQHWKVRVNGDGNGNLIGPIQWYASAPAGAFGDPHCVNANGDWFDVHAVGRIPMVILPFGINIESSDFAVVAITTPNGLDECAPTFISAVDVLANQDHDQLRIDAGPAESLQVKQINGVVNASSIKTSSDKVMITHGSVTVSVILKKVPRLDQPPFLYFDLEVAGLQSVTAGGILGADSHDVAEAQPDGCSDTRVKHRASNMYSTARAIP